MAADVAWPQQRSYRVDLESDDFAHAIGRLHFVGDAAETGIDLGLELETACANHGLILTGALDAAVSAPERLCPVHRFLGKHSPHANAADVWRDRPIHEGDIGHRLGHLGLRLLVELRELREPPHRSGEHQSDLVR